MSSTSFDDQYASDPTPAEEEAWAEMERKQTAAKLPEPMRYNGTKADHYVTGWNDCYAAMSQAIAQGRQQHGEPAVMQYMPEIVAALKATGCNKSLASDVEKALTESQQSAVTISRACSKCTEQRGEPWRPHQYTDAEIETLVDGFGLKWNGDYWVVEDADMHPMVRSLLYRFTEAPQSAEPAALDTLSQPSTQAQVKDTPTTLTSCDDKLMPATAEDAARYRAIREAAMKEDYRLHMFSREYAAANFIDFNKPTKAEMDAAIDAARRRIEGES